MGTATMTGEETILKRLARLQALADNPGTEHEATEAIAAIQRLIRKHNLSEAQIAKAEKRQSDYEMHAIPDFPDAIWRRWLLDALTGTTQCVTVWTRIKGVGGVVPTIFGQHHNIVSVLAMYDYLGRSADRLGSEEWWNESYRVRRETTPRRWKHAFRVGFAERVGDRLWEALRAEQADETNDETGLMVMEVENILEKIRKTLPHLQEKSHQMQYSDARAYGIGVEAGGRIGLNKQVGG